MYAVGNTILLMHGTFSGSVKKFTLTNEMVKDALLSQKKIKLFSNIDQAKLYANSIREEQTVYSTPRHRKKIAPIFTVEVKESANLEDLHQSTVVNTNAYTQTESQHRVEYAEIESSDIVKIFNARFLDEELPIFNFEAATSQKSCMICNLV